MLWSGRAVKSDESIIRGKELLDTVKALNSGKLITLCIGLMLGTPPVRVLIKERVRMENTFYVVGL